MAELALTEADSGKTVEVGVGDTLSVRLPEKPSTGYRWSARRAVGLRQAATRAEPAAALGGEGYRVFEFRAARAGRLELRLENRREWEPEGQPAGSFEVTVLAS